MKLAEALMQRADAQRRLAQLNQRLQQNAKYQEGEKPAENPIELLMEYRQVADSLEKLVVQINLANNQITLSNGMKMVEALAKRDRLKDEHSALIKLAEAALPEQDRYSRSEIKMLSSVDIKVIRKQADDLAKQHRELDILVQQANWQYGL
ncbi:DIP1984 family protein [Pasteurella oralis]|uniref:DIP1984 family protein n=1 Tax=Pasteurella oralis TaxID=1071947 RepID=A0ABW4NWV9_9PAST|nr:DIP1984 family protein [Pasteurella oralis]MDO5053871.1 DIP1984 family protein [Pasteurella oralis]